MEKAPQLTASSHPLHCDFSSTCQAALEHRFSIDLLDNLRSCPRVQWSFPLHYRVEKMHFKYVSHAFQQKRGGPSPKVRAIKLA
ncbi:hypothetical protein AAHA92_23732 [Salvia divinorum]|uniref:Uncharacterized protein n=1 Tax=Salvia divinorum TaxID=28513 RepID=A0ABD1GSX3_SALDI